MENSIRNLKLRVLGLAIFRTKLHSKVRIRIKEPRKNSIFAFCYQDRTKLSNSCSTKHFIITVIIQKICFLELLEIKAGPP